MDGCVQKGVFSAHRLIKTFRRGGELESWRRERRRRVQQQLLRPLAGLEAS